MAEFRERSPQSRGGFPRISRRHLYLLLVWLVVAIILAWTLAPVVNLIFASLTPDSYPLSSGLHLPEKVTAAHYKYVLTEAGIGAAILSSIIVAATTTLLSCLLAVSSAYGFSRHPSRWSDRVFMSLLFLRTLPFMTFTVPVYLASSRLGLLSTRIDLILILLFWNLPLGIWLMRSFFDMLPRELEEAGIVDGATNFQVLVKIVLPMVKPGVAVSSVFVFLYSFIEFLYGSLLTTGGKLTLPVKLASFGTGTTIFWRPLAAATVVSVLPMLVLFLIAQRDIVRGLTFGAIGKG
jgi:ABC-type glycerol-3-phosphate transport system permease component